MGIPQQDLLIQRSITTDVTEYIITHRIRLQNRELLTVYYLHTIIISVFRWKEISKEINHEYSELG